MPDENMISEAYLLKIKEYNSLKAQPCSQCSSLGRCRSQQKAQPITWPRLGSTGGVGKTGEQS